MSKFLYVVTGSGSGIGEAISRRLVAEGQLVFGIGRTRAKLEKLQNDLTPQKYSFFAADLSESAACMAAVEACRDQMQKWDVPLRGLVNNAGVYDVTPFVTTADDIWERQFQNNLLSAVRLTREFYVDLKADRPSSVLNISSTLGIRGIANTSAYSAIKAAMNNWTQVLAKEWASDGIRVNCICPGLTDTPIHGFFGKDDSNELRVQAHAAQPMGRMGTSAEIAAAAWFLLGEQSAWTTGSILSVDGGISL